jgi:hypothetical protein
MNYRAKKLLHIWLFWLLLALLGAYILWGCKSQIVDSVVPEWEISGTWQSVKASPYTELDYAHYPISVILIEEQKTLLRGSVKSDGFGILTGTDIPFTIYEGTFQNGTVHFSAKMETTGYIIHFNGTLQDKINNITKKVEKLIIGQLKFEINGSLSRLFQLYLIQQEIRYMKQTWHNQGSIF